MSKKNTSTKATEKPVKKPKQVPPKNNSSKRLTAEEFQLASSQWMSGNYTLEQLSAIHGVSVTALQRRFKRNDVKKAAAVATVQEGVEKGLTLQADLYVEKILETTNKNLNTLVGLNTYLNNQLILQIRATTDPNSKAAGLAVLSDELKAIDQARTLLQSIPKSMREAIDNATVDLVDEELETLSIGIMTPELIEQHRTKQKREDEEMGIHSESLEVQDVDDLDPAAQYNQPGVVD